MFDKFSVPTPSYVVDENLILRNIKKLKSVMDETGCKILLAQKAFSMYRLYPQIGQSLSGTTASSLFEARLGKEEMGGETHIFAPAFKDEELPEIISLCDHIVFNSFSQWERHRDTVLHADKKISCGIRVNPEYSEQETAIYDPCAPNSRMGVTLQHFRPELLDGIEGLHFHTLCEQGAQALANTVSEFEKKFGSFLPGLKWVNFGGGHHITREGYDVELLKKAILAMQEKYDVQVYLEPGEAVALDAGFLVASVLDIVHNGMDIAILDASAECHMPDVIEMPYRPAIIDSGKPGEKEFTYRLAGNTCLAGDVIGDYSFDEKLSPGDRLVFRDMAIYSMVKNNTFNGIRLPSIVLYRTDGRLELVKSFGYGDFKSRLS